MALPIVAIVGRPNVGKSALVNRISQRNDAIVHELRGVTRDRSYHESDWNGVDFMLVDTGGIEISDDDDFQGSIRNQALMAAEEADVILFVVDGTVGLQTDDQSVARLLQKTKTPVLLLVNKLDNPADESGLWEFYNLGIGEPYPVSALHGHGTGDVLDVVVEKLRESGSAGGTDQDDVDAINIAIIGRPNAGKSSLTNKLTDSDRSIVSDVAGTTRDAIDTLVEHDSRYYRIVDTAGLRRKSRIDDSVEYFGYVRAMRAIERADVVLLVIDSSIGVTNEDQRVANWACDRGCAIAVILNKWDIVEGPDAKADIREQVDEKLSFISYAPKLAISALTGKSVGRIWELVDKCYSSFTAHLSTSKLNDWIAEVKETGPTVTKGKTTLRIKYVTQTGIKPPRVAFFCNRPDVVTDNYQRFLQNRFRKSFPLEGTPVWFKFKKKD